MKKGSRAQMKRKQAALKPEGDQGDFTPAYEGADIEEKEYKRQLAKKAVEKGLKPFSKMTSAEKEKMSKPLGESSLKKHVKGHVPKPRPKPAPKPTPRPPRPPRRKPPRAIDYGPKQPRVGK